jgi:hypothetical protein
MGLHRHTGRALERWRYHVASSVLEPDAIFALVAAGYLEPQD